MERPIRRIAAAVILMLAPALAAARPAVTVYSRDLAFVREPRTLELAGARDTVRLADVPERIDFSSVRLAPSGARVLRLAYRFDVASGDAALEHAKGSRVRITLHENRIVEGVLAAVDGAWLVVLQDDGSAHTIARAMIEDVRLTAVGELALRPSIEAVVQAERRGRLDAELSYLTGGLSWNAEHTLVRSGETRATWSSDVTIENGTGRDFVDADVKLIAGDLNRATPPPMPMMARATVAMEMSAQKTADFAEESFSEYHLYTLGRPATLRDRESQKLSMIEPHALDVAPRYLYRGGDSRGVRAQLEFTNDERSGLGLPLPGGRVRIYDRDPAGDLQLVGETTIRHTPAGEKVTLEVGAAFDLAAERREVSSKRISDREREYSVEIQLRNRKKSNVTVTVEEGLPGDFEILQPSMAFTRKDANTIQFQVPVAAGKEATVRYTARVRY